MKYLIEDNVGHDQCPIAYLKGQLRLTNLDLRCIQVEDSLKTKVGMKEISRILIEEGCESLSIGGVYIIFHKTLNNLAFAKSEIDYRFTELFDNMVNHLSDEECSDSMDLSPVTPMSIKPETIEVDVPLGTVEYTREELSKELDDLFFLRDAFLVLLNEEVANKSDIVYDKKTMLKYAKGMYMNSNYSKEFIEECFATAK